MARKQKPFHIFACGVLGAGKSSLINDLLGYQICTVQDPVNTFGCDPGFLAKQPDYETKPENEPQEQLKTVEELEVRIEPEVSKIEMLKAEDRLTEAEIQEPKMTEVETPAHEVRDAEVETPAHEVGDTEVQTPAHEKLRDAEVETPAHEVRDTEVETPAHEVKVETPAHEVRDTEVETPAEVPKQTVTEILTKVERPAHEVRVNPKDRDTQMLESPKVEILAPEIILNTEVPKETKDRVMEMTEPITEEEMPTLEIGVNLETPRMEILETEGRVIEAETLEPKKEVKPENKGNPEVKTLELEDQVRIGNSDVKTIKPEDQLKTGITGIETFQQNINGVVVTVFETSTQQERHVSSVNYLQRTLGRCQEADLVLFCLDMRTSRWTDQEKDSIKNIAQTFEKDFWNKCVLVLTKANMIRVPTEERKDNRGYHERIYKRLLHEFRQQLASEGVPQSIVYRIPAVAAGEVDDDDIIARNLHYTSQKDSFVRNQRKDYLAELWLTCLERLEQKRDFLDITTAGRLDVKNSDTRNKDEDNKWMLQHIKQHLVKDLDPEQNKLGYVSLVENEGAILQFDSDQLKRIKHATNIDIPDRSENQQEECSCASFCQQCIIL